MISSQFPPTPTAIGVDPDHVFALPLPVFEDAAPPPELPRPLPPPEEPRPPPLEEPPPFDFLPAFLNASSSASNAAFNSAVDDFLFVFVSTACAASIAICNIPVLATFGSSILACFIRSSRSLAA